VIKICGQSHGWSVVSTAPLNMLLREGVRLGVLPMHG